MQIRPIAVVKFTPSEFYPHGDYADELYYPPEIGEKPSRHLKNLHSSSFSSPSLYQFPSLNDEFSNDPYKNEKKLKRSILELVDNDDDDNYYPSEIRQNPSLFISPKQIHISKNIMKRVYDDEEEEEEEDEENLYKRKLDLEFLKNNMREVIFFYKKKIK